jgi:hypothetical protein
MPSAVLLGGRPLPEGAGGGTSGAGWVYAASTHRLTVSPGALALGAAANLDVLEG